MPRQYFDAHKDRRGKPIGPAEMRRRRRQEEEQSGHLAFTVREFAKECRISAAMLYRLWKKGKGPPYRMIGNRRIIERETGLAWLREES